MRKKVIFAVMVFFLMCYSYVRLGMITFEVDQIIQDSLKKKYLSFVSAFEHQTPTNPFSKWRGYNCRMIIEGDETEITKAENLMKQSKMEPQSDDDVANATKNCQIFRQVYGYDSLFNTREERDFPVAFNILLYKDVVQVEILLRAIYRPQNTYCLHVDGRSPQHVHIAAKSLAKCFQNVFIVSKTENVVYRSFQRLQADLNCMKDHLSRPEPWKYLINLPSQEFPLKTNAEIVKILKVYNNSNDIEGILGNRRILSRFTTMYENVYKKDGSYKVVKTNKQNPNPPHNMSVVKGSAYGIFTRQFIDYVINNQTAKDLLEWCKGVLSPDEYYWAMLNHNPHLQVPGSYKGQADKKPWLAAYAAWQGVDKCTGKWLRGVCVFGIRDLPVLISRKELFANKFIHGYQPLTVHCLHEWTRNKTLSPLPFDASFYKQLPFVKDHF